MEQSNKNIQNLYKYAIPLQNNPNIGSIEYLGYKGLIVINQFERQQKIKGNLETLIYRQGWINLTKFQKDFMQKEENKNIQCKDIFNWGRTQDDKNKIENIQRSSQLNIVKIQLKGGDKFQEDVQGTYFHPDIVLDVLRYVNPKMKYIMDEIINNIIINRNEDIFQQNQLTFEIFQEQIKYFQISEQIDKIEERLEYLEDNFYEIYQQQKDQYRQLKLQLRNKEKIQIQLEKDQYQQQLQKAQQLEEEKRLKEQELQEALSKIKKVYGDIYLLRLKDSVKQQIKDEYKDFFQQLQNHLTYIGQSDCKAKDPYLKRFQQHLNEFKECESGDVNKAIIFCASKLLINKMLKDDIQLDYEQIIETVRLNRQPIKSKQLLNQSEAAQIQRQNPFLNSIIYKNYLTEEAKELSKVDRQIKKLEQDLQKEQLYSLALEVREYELKQKQELTLTEIHQKYSSNITEEMMFIVRSKNKRSQTVQRNLSNSRSNSIEKESRLQETSQKRQQLQQKISQNNTLLNSISQEEQQQNIIQIQRQVINEQDKESELSQFSVSTVTDENKNLQEVQVRKGRSKAGNCQICNERFITQKQLKEHFKQQHKQRSKTQYKQPQQ